MLYVVRSVEESKKTQHEYLEFEMKAEVLIVERTTSRENGERKKNILNLMCTKSLLYTLDKYANNVFWCH
jgi:hypothetical protein